MTRKRLATILLSILIAGISTACTGGIATSPAPTPTVTNSRYQLEYLLLAKYPNFFWCDPDIYPVARTGQEETNAQQQFPAIQANTEEFSAILEHLGMTPESTYTDAEKLSIYREHKKLSYAVTLTSSGNIYDFSIRTGENQGLHIEGTITPSGKITVLKQENSFNTCPFCLTKGTRIDTPGGLIPVEKIQPGMTVWTMDSTGNRVSAPVIKVSSTPVPVPFSVVKVSLDDGRSVTASPGHPTADMKALGDYRVGDMLDGSPVAAVDHIIYYGGATYDLLPSGGTGLYWANGILLESTLKSY